MDAINKAIKTVVDIPFHYRKLFEQYDSFNTVQSAFLEDLLHTDKSVVLSAPTGSGKTVAFELAIIRMLETHRHQQQHEVRLPPPKAIYVAPIKALCAEKFLDWKARFEPLNVKCAQVTGDSDGNDLMAIRGAQLIVTTPEKWDSLTRHWRDCPDVMGSIQLFIVDEVHLLNEDVRGPILEAIVSRMKTIIACDSTMRLRFVMASATIPNIEDLTSWIGNSNNSATGSAVQFVFSDMQRPVPLEKHILGFNSRLKGFQFDMSLNYKLHDILRKYSEGKATLIFCNSRKSTEMAAAVLLQKSTNLFPLNEQQKGNLLLLTQRLHDAKLRKLIPAGIAFHHAGLTYDDRRLIEENFRGGLLMALLCTNTLAMGVNLPAHLVIVKSTESYCRGSFEEYPESTLLQMIGRAGRPQYDTKGTAVILTHTKNVRKYENLMNGKKMPVESHLHKHLAEHLNSEIALNTINNLEVAMNWIRSTYLYVRSVRNPGKYGLDGHVDTDIIERKLEEMCLVQINALHSAGLVTRNTEDNLDVQTTAYGQLMAKYYISFETMKLFRQVRGNESFLEILNMIVRCKEFSEFTVRVNEKKVLNELNSVPIRFPIRGRIKEREDKISCLIQATFGNLSISSPGLAQESVKMIRIGDRISKCLLEYLRLSGSQLNDLQAGGCYKALLHAVTIAKCFSAKLWENSDYAAKQLLKIGAVYSSLLANAGKTTLKSIGETDARNIELILNKSYPFGDEVLQNLMVNFPEYTLELRLKSTDMLHVSVKQINEEFVFNGSSASIIVGDSLNNLLLFSEHIDRTILEYGFFEKTIKIPNLQVESINAHLIHTTLVGVDAHSSIVINEPPPQDSAKKATKRKRQSKLTLSKRNKIDSNSDSIIEQENNALDISAIPDDSFLIGLQKLSFSKPKLLPASKKSSTTFKSPAEVTQKSFKSKSINNLDYVPSPLSVTDITNPNNNSVLVQKKVTEYYTSKKQYSATTTKSNECEIMTLDDSNTSVHNKISQSECGGSVRVEENCDSVILETVDCCLTQNSKKPLDLSKKTIIANDITHTQKQAKIPQPNYNLRSYDLNNSVSLIISDHSCLNFQNDLILSPEGNHSQFNLSLISTQCASNYKPQQQHNRVVDSFNISITSFPETITATKIDKEMKQNITNYDDTLIESPEDNEDFIKSMYRVAKEFIKQNPVLHTYANFKRIYHKMMANKDLKPTDKQSPNNISFANNNKSKNLRSSSLIRRNANSMPSSRGGLTNPFRLQLFEKDENVEKFSPATVDSINRSVMNYVLHTKCEQDQNHNNKLDEINEINYFTEFEEELQLNETQSKRPLTFEDYCRLFLDGNITDL